jgi:hypothetical protein
VDLDGNNIMGPVFLKLIKGTNLKISDAEFVLAR